VKKPRPAWVLPILLGLVTCVVFSSEIGRLLNAWIHDPYTRYGFLIPPITAYLLYKKKEKLPEDFSDAYTGAALALISIPLLYLARTYGDISHIALAFLPFVFGLSLTAYSRKGVREAWFPLAYLGLMFPLPTTLTTRVSIWMSGLTYNLTIAWLQILGINYMDVVTQEGATPIISVCHQGEQLAFGMDTSCLAVYSLLGFLAFGAFFAYTTTGKIYKRILLVGTGCLLLILLNGLRIAIILGIATAYGEGLAVDLFHLFGGWVLIAVSFLTVLMIMERSGEKIRV